MATPHVKPFHYPRGRVFNHALAVHRRKCALKRHGMMALELPNADQATFFVDTPLDCGDQGQCGCHASTDEVLTTEGWQQWENYDWKAPLGTMNQETGQLEFQSPLQQHIYDYDGPMYFSDHRSVDFALTPNHRLYVRKWNERKRTLDDTFQFVEVQKLGWYAGLPHATSGWAGTDLTALTVGNRTYDGDNFLALLALFLSDGWAGGSESSRNHVGFCCFREDRGDMVRHLAYNLGLREQPSRPGVWMYQDPAMAEWLRQNIYTDDVHRAAHKRIPQLVKCASQRQIEHFLRFFGDQHIQKDGTRRFYSSSRLMIDDLQELLLRISKRGTIEERPQREAHFPDGRTVKSNGPDLTLTERRTSKLSFEKKQLRTDHYRGKVYCATVPNGTLVTRRNGSILISGNSCYLCSAAKVCSNALVRGGVLPNDQVKGMLSWQYGLDCQQFGGCNGGDEGEVIQWIHDKGFPTTDVYGPYHGSEGSCGSGVTPLYKIKDFGYCDPQSQAGGIAATQLIKNCLVKYGNPISVAAAAGGDWDNLKDGDVISSTSGGVNHAISLVGWDDTKGATLSVAVNIQGGVARGGGAWAMENQWSPQWGYVINGRPGRAWILYGADSIGTEAIFVDGGQPLPPPPPWEFGETPSGLLVARPQLVIRADTVHVHLGCGCKGK